MTVYHGHSREGASVSPPGASVQSGSAQSDSVQPGAIVQPASGQAAGGGSDAQPADLRADIVAARAELGQTLQALAERADVPARARASASHAAHRALAAWRTPGPWLVLSAGLGAASLVVLAVRGWRR